MHDTIGCYLDLDKGQISFSKNGAVSVIIVVMFFVCLFCFMQLWMSCESLMFLVSLCFRPGNDLGLAFEIPQHVKNQPFFASCVLKVPHQYKGRKQTNSGNIYKEVS